MKILFVQPNLNPPGGGNGVAAWMLQALQDVHEVTLLTWEETDWARVNGYFGTALDAARIRTERIPSSLGHLLSAIPLPLGLLRSALLCRHARSMRAAFDVAMTAANESDLGAPAVQYVHFPRLDRHRPDVDLRWYHASRLVDLYYAATLRVTGFSIERARANLTVANSEWTARRLERRVGIRARVLHPPVTGDFPERAWDRREDTVVCVGRLSPEKRIERVVGIVEKLRRRGHGLRLHVVGSPDDDAYVREIRALARRHESWMQLSEDLPRHRLCAVLAGARYGLHAMLDEHFGIAVAEMVRAGCIVFAPDDGGQVEILRHPGLLYRDDDEAVAKLERVFVDARWREDVRRHLDGRATELDPARFLDSVRQLVDEVARRGSRPR